MFEGGTCLASTLTVSDRQLTDVEFSSAGHAFSVLLAVIGVQHRLSEHTMNILKPGFEFLISSLRSTKRGEWAQILNQDPERAKEANSDFFLSVYQVNHSSSAVRLT